MESINHLRDYADTFGDEGREELRELADAIEEELAERYVALPVDADGVPIHLGDVMEFTDDSVDEDGNNTFIVGGFDSEFPEGRGRLLVADDDNACWYPDQLRHHPPTVEDVLAEFTERYDSVSSGDEGHAEFLALLAEYSKKLRLAGED